MSRASEASTELRWFFLDAAPAGIRARLAADDGHHAARVLRLGPGEALIGLDGAGSTWHCRVVAVHRSEVEVEVEGAPQRAPRPGTPGAELPSLEVAVCAPRGDRGEELLERLVQLGVDRVTWLVAQRSQGFDRRRVEQRMLRWQRVAREACKQSRRPWLPDLVGPLELTELAARSAERATILLSPRATRPLRELAGAGGAAGLRLIVGPEGGWTPEEEAALVAAGALPAVLAPYVLRVETAAEVAAAVVLHAAWTPR